MNSLRSVRGNSGFTFIEITVVLIIFVLLAGGIYATVNTAITATVVLSEENLRSQRLTAFVSLLRHVFHNLPASAQISGGVRVDGGKAIPEIVLRDAPGAFSWGGGESAAGTVLVSAVPRLGGGMQFSLLALPSSLGEQQRREALQDGKWLRLLPDIREARWRFYDETRQDWREDWLEGMDRPQLLELSFRLLGEDVARTYMFWIPPVKEPVATERQQVLPDEELSQEEPPPSDSEPETP